MKYINKFREPFHSSGVKLNQDILESHWNNTDGTYFSLRYGDFDKKKLQKLLCEEQDGLCCYCMRRLYTDTSKKNITIEHVIPNKITSDQWDSQKAMYEKNVEWLHGPYITVIPTDTSIDKTIKFGMPPFPHFIAYYNLVASCDGKVLTDNDTQKPQHCCNSNRGNSYVEPLFFKSDVSEQIAYDHKGRIICDESLIPYFAQKNGLNLSCNFLVKVRHFWNFVANSDYTPDDVIKAIDDDDLRQEIIDIIFPVSESEYWKFLEEKKFWLRYSDFDWYYGYYRDKILNQQS